MVAEHAALVQQAQTLVFVYPTWWSQPPAILRGWLERVLVPGVAFRFDDKGKVRPGLQHVRRIIGISTYGAPWTYVKLLNDGGRRMLTRALRMNCGAAHADDVDRPVLDGHRRRRASGRAFLDRVEHRWPTSTGSPTS